MSLLGPTSPPGLPEQTLPPQPTRAATGPGPLIHRWLYNSGLIFKFTGLVVRDTLSGRVIVFIGETIRQAGILIVSSTLVICGLIFIIGLQCGIEGAYLLQSQGAPQYAGLFSAWCDLRELAPLCFGYMMAAKVGTGIVAELGSMRISEEIDALEVMGINGITFLCATRLLASWLVLPFVYLGGVAFGFLASYIAVVQQVANVSAGGYSLIFWEFQNPGDLLFSLIKGMAMATVIVLVGCYYGYTASGGPVGVGVATAKSMVVNIVSVHIIGMLGTQLFWGANPRAPIGG
jgi:phospholipid/cholesterol/gamma-HCH transport system permease protein